MADFEMIAQGMILVRINAPKIARSARPGQFVQRRGHVTQGLVGDDGRAQTPAFDPQPYPIHSVDTENGEVTALAVTDVGNESEISSAPTGLEWAIRGPLGTPVTVDPSAQHVAFISNGGGIAALIAVLRETAERGVRVTLMAGAENAWQLYPSRLLPEDVREMTATDDGSAGARAPVTHLLPQVQDEADLLIASGSTRLYEDLARMRADGLLTIPTTVLMLPRIGCRNGECGECAVQTANGPRLACAEGPSFDLDEVDWGEPTTGERNEVHVAR